MTYDDTTCLLWGNPPEFLRFYSLRATNAVLWCVLCRWHEQVVNKQPSCCDLRRYDGMVFLTFFAELSIEVVWTGTLTCGGGEVADTAVQTLTAWSHWGDWGLSGRAWGEKWEIDKCFSYKTIVSQMRKSYLLVSQWNEKAITLVVLSKWKEMYTYISCWNSLKNWLQSSCTRNWRYTLASFQVGLRGDIRMLLFGHCTGWILFSF